MVPEWLQHTRFVHDSVATCIATTLSTLIYFSLPVAYYTIHKVDLYLYYEMNLEQVQFCTRRLQTKTNWNAFVNAFIRLLMTCTANKPTSLKRGSRRQLLQTERTWWKAPHHFNLSKNLALNMQTSWETHNTELVEKNFRSKLMRRKLLTISKMFTSLLSTTLSALTVSTHLHTPRSVFLECTKEKSSRSSAHSSQVNARSQLSQPERFLHEKLASTADFLRRLFFVCYVISLAEVPVQW